MRTLESGEQLSADSVGKQRVQERQWPCNDPQIALQVVLGQDQPTPGQSSPVQSKPMPQQPPRYTYATMTATNNDMEYSNSKRFAMQSASGAGIYCW